MQQTFTQNDLLKYLYSESDIIQSFMIEQQLSYDYPLKEAFQLLKRSKEMLSEISLSPSQATVDSILAYGAWNQPVQTK